MEHHNRYKTVMLPGLAMHTNFDSTAHHVGYCWINESLLLSIRHSQGYVSLERGGAFCLRYKITEESIAKNWWTPITLKPSSASSQVMYTP